jgi:translation initiation factor 2 alpha subunit (eIF-2alpha)
MEEGDLALCKVEKVTNTITFVNLPDGKEGTIVSSEIASGRIKLMRQYVVPNKQIVCKVLRIDGDHIHLSLRRVNSKERKEVMSAYKQSQAIHIAFKQILGNKEDEIKEKILKDYKDLNDFAYHAKTDESLVEKYIPKENRTAIKKILEKKKKNTELKQNIKIKCLRDDGVQKIKELFIFENPNFSINYISAGNFRLKLIVQDFKEGKKIMTETIENLEKKAKELEIDFHASEER